MFPKFALSLPPLIRPLLVLMVLGLSASSGYIVNIVPLDFEIIFALAILLVGITSLWLGEQGIRLSFLALVLMFALGWRRITIASGVAIHPLIPFICVLFGFLVVKVVVIERRHMQWRVPLSLLLFSLFWWWGLLVAGFSGAEPIPFVLEFLNFVILLPLFAIMYFVLTDQAYWKWTLSVFYGVGVLIATLGIAESVGLLPGALSTAEVIITSDGYARATFAFFGGPAAVLLCVLALPAAPLIWVWFPQWYFRLALLATIVIQLYAIYISGTRAAWLMVVILFIALMQMKRGWLGVMIACACLAGTVPFLPPAVESRLYSLVDFDERGSLVDTSNQKRADRYQEAVDAMLTRPTGVGWSNAGWVHSDFLQVGANLGIVAGLLFMGWYAVTLLQGWWAVMLRRDTFLLPSLVASQVCVGVILVFEGVQVLTQYIVPTWFIWVLVHVRLDQLRSLAADTTTPQTYLFIRTFHTHKSREHNDKSFCPPPNL